MVAINLLNYENMDNSKSRIIREIAQELDCGNDCYYNPKTDEIVSIPNFGQISDEDEFRDAFSAELKKVNKNKTEFIKIEVLESFESFKIIERFVSEISDKHFQAELENILERKKPFQNFKNRIDNSDFRQNWFDFKKTELEKIVETQLNRGKASAQQCI
jgi:antirestriction protein ArdC